MFTYVPLNNDTVYCRVTSAIGCTNNNPASSNEIIMIAEPLIINTGNDTNITCGNRAYLHVTTNALSSEQITYKWTPSTGLSSDTLATPYADTKTSILYKVKVQGRTGCNPLTDSINITVNPINVDTLLDQTLYCKGEVQLNAITNLTAGTTILNYNEAGLNTICFTDENTGFAGGDEGTILKTTDGGESWTSNSSGTFDNINVIYFIPRSKGMIGFIGGSFSNAVSEKNLPFKKTTDGGTNWTIIESKIPPYSINTIYFLNADTGFAAGSLYTQCKYYSSCYDNYILKTTNRGIDWDTINMKVGIDVEATIKSMFFTDIKTGYAVGNTQENDGLFVKTMDGGNTWLGMRISKIQDFDLRRFNSIYFTDQNTGYASGFMYPGIGPKNNLLFIIKTTDVGNTWNILNVELSNEITSIYFINQNTGYAIEIGGEIIMTNDGGASWLTLNSGTNYNLSSMSFNGNVIYATGTTNPDVIFDDYYQNTYKGEIIKFPSQVIYKWSPSVTLSSDTIENPYAFPTTTTTYKVTVTGTEGCSPTNDSVRVTVTPFYTDAGRDTSIMCNETVQMYIKTDTNKDINFRFKWAPSVGLSSDTIRNPVARYINNSNGYQDYKVTITSTECIGNVSDSVRVNYIPLKAELKPNDTITCGESAYLMVTTNCTGCDSLRYNWSPPYGLSNTDSSTTRAFPINSTLYTVEITSPDSTCRQAPASEKVEVLAPDYNPDFTVTQQTLVYPMFTAEFINNTPNINDYDFIWNFGDSIELSSNDSIVKHAYKKDGNYTVNLTAENKLSGCRDSLVRQNYISCKGLVDGINEISMNLNQLTIMPNPVIRYSTIYYQLSEASQVTIKIYDLMGNEINTIVDKYEMKGEHKVVIDTGEYIEGVYIVRLGKDVVKFVKL